MAKAPAPGRVKTRLIGPDLDADAAAAIHRAMLVCVLQRIATLFGGPRVLAVAGDLDDDLQRVATGWRIIPQRGDDLGQRLDHAWLDAAPQGAGSRAVIFLGTDSPDVPAASLAAIAPALRHADAAVGPVGDGGYWTLAAADYHPPLLARIDWGSGRVYDQTRDAADRARLRLATLPAWHDVDHPPDLEALRRRLADAHEPPLRRLRERLDSILKPLNKQAAR